MSYTREEWFLALLSSVGNPHPTDDVKAWMCAWTQLETGPYSPAHPGARFNLLDTTESWKLDGTAFQTTNFNSAGVKNYASFADGIAANAKVLHNGKYPHLLAALQKNDESALKGPTSEIAAELDTWGTGHGASISKLASTKDGLRPGEQFPGIADSPPPSPPASSDSGELPNYPFKNERTERDINHDLDCVPDGLASMLQFVTGKPFTGADLKIAVKGAAFRGGMAASEFIGYCRAHGARLFAIPGDGMALVRAIRAQLQASHPTLATEPNPYGNPHFSHVVAFYKWDAHTLTVMDPFGAHPVRHSDAEWAALFLYHQVWAMERMYASMIPSGWKDDGNRLVAPNGIGFVHGFRAWVLAHNWSDDDWPLEEEHPQVEDQVDPSAGATEQTTRKHILEWDKTNGVREMWVGQECLALWKENAALRAQLAAAAPAAPAALASLLIKADRAEILATVAMLRDGADHLMEEINKLPGN